MFSKKIFWLAAVVASIVILGLFALWFVSTRNAVPLTHGPLAGNVTDTGASIWFRTQENANVAIRYSEHPDLTNSLTSAPVPTNAAQNFQAQLALRDLKPNTTYYYDVLVNDVPQLAAPFATFKTFAPRGESVAFRFGILTDFGSRGGLWQDEVPIETETFSKLAQENPAFVILGGDFWHNEVDTRDFPLTSAQEYVTAERSRYLQMYSLNSELGPYDDFVKKILPNFALAHFWDDHDIGRNNADKNYRFNKQALQVLQESFPTYPLGQAGDWQFFSYGQADFFLLDARTQRDSRGADENNKSMLDGTNLGADGQLAWLKNGLKNSTARWKIIFSPVVFNPTIEKKDAWYGYLQEHDALVQFIRDENIQGVFFVSGDAHVGAMDDGTNAGLPEMVVPGPNMIRSCFTSQNQGEWSHGLYGNLDNTGCRGYGIVEILTNPDRARLLVKDEHGATKLELELK